MIVIAGSFTVRPERRDEAVQVALRMAAATRAEPGCVEYRFFADLEDRNRFFLFEHWQSDDALARHFQTPHMAELRARLPDLLAGPSSVRRYTVSDVAPM